MARVRTSKGTPDATPRIRGHFITRVTKHGLIAQKWPRKRGPARTPGERYHQAEFALAATQASDPEPLMYQTAIELAKGSDQVPRDLIMMATYGLYYRIGPIEGIQPTIYRMVAANAQLTLDQVTDTVGAMLVRTAVGWVEVLPGNDGQYLGHAAGIPIWQNVSLASGGAANIAAPLLAHADVYITPGVVAASTFTNVPTNTNQLWLVPFTVPFLINATKMACSIGAAAAGSGQTGRMGVYAMRPTDGQPTVCIIDGGTVSTNSTGLKTVTISAILAPGTYYMAWWVSTNCSPRGVGGSTGVAGVGVRILPTTMNMNQCLRNTIAYTAAFPDLTNVTMGFPATSDGYPIIGIK